MKLLFRVQAIAELKSVQGPMRNGAQEIKKK
jgi:hypothetical protein